MKDPLRVRQKQGVSLYGWDSSATPQNDSKKKKRGGTEWQKESKPTVLIRGLSGEQKNSLIKLIDSFNENM